MLCQHFAALLINSFLFPVSYCAVSYTIIAEMLTDTESVCVCVRV